MNDQRRVNVCLYNHSGTHIGSFNRALSDYKETTVLIYQDRWFTIGQVTFDEVPTLHFHEVNKPSELYT